MSVGWSQVAGLLNVIALGSALVVVDAGTARADEIWVTPTYQRDTGGLGVGSNQLWPVTTAGAVRLTWAVPNDLEAFESAKVIIIPNAPAVSSTLNVFICPARKAI
jgi:hypothetical protein